MGEAKSPLRQAGQFQFMVEPAAQILRKLARVREKQEKCTHLEQNRWSTLVSPYLPHESTRSRGNVGGPAGHAVDKSQVVVGGTLGEGVEGTQAS